MKIDFNQKPVKKDGNPYLGNVKNVKITMNDDGSIDQEPTFETMEMTLGTCAMESLLKGAHIIDVKETMLRYNLRNRIKDGGEVEVSEEELNKLKELINARYEIDLSGQLLIMLGEK